MELKDLLAVSTLLTFLCPGLIFVYVHTVVSRGTGPEVTKDNLAAFVAVSAIYTVAVTAVGLLPSPLLPNGPSLAGATVFQRSEVMAFAFLGPAILGGMYAAAKQRDIFYRLAILLRLHPINPSPSAWETGIKRLVQGDYVIATLKDGKRISGNLDHLASFSSKDGCNDMLLSETTPPPGQNEGVTRATWIASGEIQTLEIVTRRIEAQKELLPTDKSSWLRNLISRKDIRNEQANATER
jgi:hypothetical protein